MSYDSIDDTSISQPTFDADLAELIGIGLTKNLEQFFEMEKIEKKTFEIAIYHKSNKGILYTSYISFNRICLEDSFCGFLTLERALREIRYNKKAIHSAKFSSLKTYYDGLTPDWETVLFFQDANDVDYTSSYMDPEVSKLCYTDDPVFEKKFKTRNLDCVIKEYNGLKCRLGHRKHDLEAVLEEIEEFKKGLSEEDLLAIEALD